jgi:2-polyprenyl-3-methyl-5-hydroxy-6-metoxy-1,4-benzoquinol methylase
MKALLSERPIWFATGPLSIEEEAEMEDPIYHRPVLVGEVLELLAPKAGSLVVDATCGGGGHSEAILRAGANILASLLAIAVLKPWRKVVVANAQAS